MVGHYFIFEWLWAFPAAEVGTLKKRSHRELGDYRIRQLVQQIADYSRYAFHTKRNTHTYLCDELCRIYFLGLFEIRLWNPSNPSERTSDVKSPTIRCQTGWLKCMYDVAVSNARDQSATLKKADSAHWSCIFVIVDTSPSFTTHTSSV